MADMNGNQKLYQQKLSYRSNSTPCPCLAQPWFIQMPQRVYMPRHGNHLETMICGEKVFGAIFDDLKAAQHTVDIITWGFDPGMVLVRETTAESGLRYGDLLKQIATRKENPVLVRLLIWHDDAAAQYLMNNAPGIYGRLFPAIGSAQAGYYSDAHHVYNAAWYDEISSGAIPTIQLHVRDIPHVLMPAALWDETLPDGIGVSGLLSAMYPAHHQKMVLIDYENPPKAIGYVMGHNSVTDFWDSAEHIFRDPKRERIYRKPEAEIKAAARGKSTSRRGVAFAYLQTEEGKRARDEATEIYIENNSHIAKPYQDVSCRVQGPILYDLNHNFCQGWQESERPGSFFFDFLKANPFWRLAVAGVKKAWDSVHDELDADFIKRRKSITVGAFNLRKGQHSAQLVRTQPQHDEKGAKECYANLTRQMLHYIFIQNQYIQYATWAEHLMFCVGQLRSAGYHKPIYVFMLTSTPERAGMDYPTYEVVSKMGISEAMKVEHEAAMARARQGKGEQPITLGHMEKQGINVFMGMLWTCADIQGKLKADDYEEIYIHSKVAVVDDAAFTIGSANLNLRSMAMDSELNVLSQAQEVAFQLRGDLFYQCSRDRGPAQFANMEQTFKQWRDKASANLKLRDLGEKLSSQLLPFQVDRKPGSPLV